MSGENNKNENEKIKKIESELKNNNKITETIMYCNKTQHKSVVALKSLLIILVCFQLIIFAAEIIQFVFDIEELAYVSNNNKEPFTLKQVFDYLKLKHNGTIGIAISFVNKILRFSLFLAEIIGISICNRYISNLLNLEYQKNINKD